MLCTAVIVTPLSSQDCPTNVFIPLFSISFICSSDTCNPSERLSLHFNTAATAVTAETAITAAAIYTAVLFLRFPLLLIFTSSAVFPLSSHSAYIFLKASSAFSFTLSGIFISFSKIFKISGASFIKSVLPFWHIHLPDTLFPWPGGS